MKILANRNALLDALSAVSSVVPARSPKPVLLNVKLAMSPDDGSWLMATDLEAGIRYSVLGLKCDEPGSVLLPTARIIQILRTSNDEELAIETDGEQLTIRGLHSEFVLNSEDPDLFPDVAGFGAATWHTVAASDLRKLIRRTAFATDSESTRYALGGCLLELTDDSISLVGTDGRRMAKATATASTPNYAPIPTGLPVLPVKALKLIERNLDDKATVDIAITATSATFRTSRATFATRLVEGRFPRYQDVFPKGSAVTIPIEVGPLLSQVEAASIFTSEESRGVDFLFSTGLLNLASQADVGKSRVVLPIDYESADISICFDPRYLTDALKTIDPASIVKCSLIDSKNAVVFRTGDQYDYVVMPLTKDR